MRSRFTTHLIVTLALVATGALPALAADVVVNGGGWGHGIGMSQWGAQAMAQDGKSAEQILTHFYSEAQFGEVGDEFVDQAEPLHIGVGQNLTSTSFRPINGNLTVCQAGQCHTAAPGETWTLQFIGSGQCRLLNGAVVMVTGLPCNGEITWEGQPNTRVNFLASARTYARGRIVFKPNDPDLSPLTPPTGFHVVIEVPLEAYLYGLGEVPSNWEPEALHAQAIAARTYALYKAYVWRAGPNPVCGCHLYSTTADQAYLGWHTSSNLTEAGSGGSNWKAAVDATAGKAMWHSYHPLTPTGHRRAMEAYYFSSTGDNTENNEEKWGGNPYPYLRSVDDPGATSWTKGFSYASFAGSLGFSEVTWVNIVDRYDSGRPTAIEVQGTISGSPATQTFSSLQFANELSLKAQWVHSVDGFIPPGADKVVLHNPGTGQWSYRGANGGLSTIFFGNPGDRAFFGDWNCDGTDTPGLYRQSDGYVYLRNSNTQGIADISFFFGNPGDIPIAGDFDGDGCDTVSIYRPSEARFYIINELGSADKGLGAADYSYLFGNPGDVPFVGDWNGDGTDTPGLRRSSNGFVYLRNTNTQGAANISFFYGNPGDVVFAGDWDSDDDDSIGLYRPSNGTVYLRNALSTGVADITYQMGGSQHRAVAGAY